ncbi:MAG: hypothetical protein HQ592_18455 [Planctomycetes bacterium]|nr:hypothetical protein [Planctomycetota bacterium]
MSQELINLISTGGAGVAVTVVTFVFLRFLRAERNQLMSDRREERRQFLQRLDAIAERLELLAQSVNDCRRCPRAGAVRESVSDLNTSKEPGEQQ